MAPHPRIHSLLAGGALALLIAACSQSAHEHATQSVAKSAASEQVSANAAADSSALAAEAPAAAPMPPSVAEGVAPTSAAPSAAVSPQPRDLGAHIGDSADPARRFVVTAEARFRVKDVYATVSAIEDAVAAERGFIVEDRIGSTVARMQERALPDATRLQLSEVATTGELVVRLPAARTEAFLRSLAQHMEVLDGRDITTRDVQFDELRKRLEARREQALAQRLGQVGEGGGRMADKVDAANAGAEAMAARDEAIVAQRELDDSIAFSTVRLSLHQPPLLRSVVVPDVAAQMRAQSPGFAARMAESLRTGLNVVLDAVVALTQAWPVWLLLGAMVIGLRRWRVQRGASAAARAA